MISFDDDEKRSIGGIYKNSSDDFGQASKNSDVRAGSSGVESAFSEKKSEKSGNSSVSSRGEQTVSTILSEVEDEAFEPLVEQMRSSVFTVTVKNARADFIAPLSNVLADISEHERTQQFKRDFEFQSLFGRALVSLQKIQDSTSLFVRPQGFIGNIFEKLFVSRRREGMSVVNAILEQTNFMRTGKLDRDRGFFESIFEPQAIGRGFLKLATGFGIGRDKAAEADRKKANGEQLSFLERISSGVYQDITFQNHSEVAEKTRGETLLAAIQTQTSDDWENALYLSESINGRLSGVESGIIGAIHHGIADPLFSIANDVPLIDINPDLDFSFDRDTSESVGREKTMVEVLKEQFLVMQEELPKLTDQMRELLSNGGGGGSVGGFGAGAASAGITGWLMRSLGGGRGGGPRVSLLTRLMTGFRDMFGALGRIRLPWLATAAAAVGLYGATQNSAEDNIQLGGSIVGGVAGAKGGALAGSFAGPVGTVVGGILGGTAGFIVGENLGEMIGGLLSDSVYETLSEDIDDQSKTGAGRFVKSAFNVMGSVWDMTAKYAGPLMSDVWDTTKSASSSAFNWVTEATKDFAIGGGKRFGNLFVDSVSEVSGLVGTTLLNGVTAGIPALGGLIWKTAEWYIEEFSPAMFSLFGNLLAGIGDFSLTVLGRIWDSIKSSSLFAPGGIFGPAERDNKDPEWWRVTAEDNSLYSSMPGAGSRAVNNNRDRAEAFYTRWMSENLDFNPVSGRSNETEITIPMKDPRMPSANLLDMMRDGRDRPNVAPGRFITDVDSGNISDMIRRPEESWWSKLMNNSPSEATPNMGDQGSSADSAFAPVTSPDTPTNNANSVDNVNEVGSRDYKEVALQYSQKAWQDAAEASQAEYQRIMQETLNIDASIVKILERANSTAELTKAEVTKMVDALKNRPDSSNGAGQVIPDFNTSWTILGMGE
jgi:hypothetical protein